MKNFFDVFSLEDLKKVNNSIIPRAKNRKKFMLTVNGEELPVQSVVPVTSVPAPMTPPTPWWQSYKKSQIVCLDCEMVSVIIGYKGNGKPKCTNSAATVAICDMKYNILLSETIKHLPGTFLVDSAHVRLTGFTRNSLEHGKDLVEVQNLVKKVLNGKLVIVKNGSSDFSSLDLALVNDSHSVFDLEQEYRRSKTILDNFGMETEIEVPIKLKELHAFYFPNDRPLQAEVHSAEQDCIATMKIFKEAYIPNKVNVTSKISDRLYDEIPVIT